MASSGSDPNKQNSSRTSSPRSTQVDKNLERTLQVLPPAQLSPVRPPLLPSLPPRARSKPLPAIPKAQENLLHKLIKAKTQMKQRLGVEEETVEEQEEEEELEDEIQLRKRIRAQAKASAQETSPACCRYHWEMFQEEQRNVVDAAVPFRPDVHKPQLLTTAQKNLQKKDKLTKIVMKDIHGNERRQSPLSTILVRWHKFRNDPGYTIESLLTALRPFGDVTSVIILSECSARVTFAHLDVACKVMAAERVGRRQNLLTCSWYHKDMEKKKFFMKKKHLHVLYNPF